MVTKTHRYTIFDRNDEDEIYTKEGLLEHLMVLLAGRIAEEIFLDILLQQVQDKI